MAVQASRGHPGRRMGGRCIVAIFTTAQDFIMVDDDDWHPTTGLVAGIANIGARDMGSGFARMAGGTNADDFAVIDDQSHQPTTGAGMAGAAVIRAGDVLGSLARGSNAIMAGLTVTQDLCMVDSDYRCPGHCGMAELAAIGGTDMANRFAGKIDVIVTTAAITGDALVTEGDDAPIQGARMAGVALGYRGQVVGDFTLGSGAVVATAACPK